MLPYLSWWLRTPTLIQMKRKSATEISLGYPAASCTAAMAKINATYHPPSTCQDLLDTNCGRGWLTEMQSTSPGLGKVRRWLLRCHLTAKPSRDQRWIFSTSRMLLNRLVMAPVGCTRQHALQAPQLVKHNPKDKTQPVPSQVPPCIIQQKLSSWDSSWISTPAAALGLLGHCSRGSCCCCGCNAACRSCCGSGCGHCRCGVVIGHVVSLDNY